MKALIVPFLAALLTSVPLEAQEQNQDTKRLHPDKNGKLLDLDDAIKTSMKILLEVQEGENSSQWPYEGVYRVRGKIPVGYRVGGTSIGATALIESPGYGKDQKRQQAVGRAVGFVLKGLKDPLMKFDTFRTGYDVRGWGHAYALLFLIRLQDLGLEPANTKTKIKTAVKSLVKGLQTDEITSGGWNYSRRGGRRRGQGGGGSPSSPFMTAPTLQALFLAKARGHKVSTKVVKRALDSLVRGRTEAGGYGYSMPVKENYNSQSDADLGMMHKLPGSIARAPAVETTLMLAGRGDLGRLRKSVDDFFTHWDALEVRRQKSGTHIRPYGVAPYYFIYGHYYVAQAIEMIPNEKERTSYRERLNRTLSFVRDEDGSWNGRVFERSKAYGTAMSIMALQMQKIPGIPAWKGGKQL